jgi:hypothetical protein
MARNFRPVKTIWGESSSCFIPSEDVEKVLLGLADAAGCEMSSESRDGLYTELWIDNGKAFFDYLKQETRTPQELADELALVLLTAEDLEDSIHADVVDDVATLADFESFMQNLRAYADQWQANDLDPKDGSLRFYVD